MIYNPTPSPDLSAYLKLDQTTPQTTVGTFTFPSVVVPNGGFYKYGAANFMFGNNAQNNSFFGGGGNLTMSGSFNTSIGSRSMLSMTSGSTNLAMGYNSLTRNETASNNTAIGAYALEYTTSGGLNTAIGAYALGKITTSTRNIGIGYSAGFNSGVFGSNETSERSIYIGVGDDGVEIKSLNVFF